MGLRLVGGANDRKAIGKISRESKEDRREEPSTGGDESPAER